MATLSLAGADTGTMEDTMLDKGTNAPKRKGLFQSCAWFKEKPLRRWIYAAFLLFAPASMLWVIVKASSGVTGDVLAGIGAVVLALWGAQHFKILLGIKENVDRLARSNREFKKESCAMKHQVDKLMKAHEELTATSDQLMDTTKQYKSNIEKFKSLDEKLNSLADDSIAGLGALKEMSKTVMDSITKEMVQHEREVLSTTYQALEYRDDQDGLTEQEFKAFVNALPANFQERFSTMSEQGKSFKEIAGADGVMDMTEFTDLCDEFAQQAAAGQ